ncbi:hypothetical protein FE697_007220 [Mumia zhuanghuii]|uniref:BON domain-containing protein n=2 Tax=Mumia TaxID=1546255 RepID=A0ABW1QNF8_9ACTN|nr:MULTISPECIES: hypothetical protein [Mumia]KAA1423394.1 hypothetical protein FE697_007220 [Mumia zhuanghuii]
MPTRRYTIPADVEQHILDNIALRLAAARATAQVYFTIENDYVLEVDYALGTVQPADLDNTVRSVIPDAEVI